MNDPKPIAAAGHELQFNEAEFSGATPAGATCTGCQLAIPNQYYQVNGAVLCERCSTAVKSLMTGGSAFPRFLKASVFGLGAGFAGFLIYFGVLKATGYEIGLISILVGYMVGTAVRRGSSGRGGFLYQALAVLCTYLAIAASYSALAVPQLIAEMKKGDAADAQAKDAAKANAKIDVPDEPVPPKELTPLTLAFLLLVVGAFMLTLPILTGLSQPVSLLIVGFALWEAWKLNRKMELVITGPHQVGLAPVQAPAHA